MTISTSRISAANERGIVADPDHAAVAMEDRLTQPALALLDPLILLSDPIEQTQHQQLGRVTTRTGDPGNLITTQLHAT